MLAMKSAQLGWMDGWMAQLLRAELTTKNMLSATATCWESILMFWGYIR